MYTMPSKAPIHNLDNIDQMDGRHRSHTLRIHEGSQYPVTLRHTLYVSGGRNLQPLDNYNTTQRPYNQEYICQ